MKREQIEILFQEESLKRTKAEFTVGWLTAILRDDFGVDTQKLLKEIEEKADQIYEGIYLFEGRKYRKLRRDEKIAAGAIHSFAGAPLHPICSKETIGQTPNNFSEKRDFFNPV